MTRRAAGRVAARRGPLAAGAGLLAALLVIYARLIFERLILAGYDVQTYFFPYWSYAFRALREGDLPLWNPELFLGAPFLANPQPAVFYLPNWLLLPLDPERAISVAVMLHVALAAAGMLVLARGPWGRSWPAATVAALVFAFGGFFAAQGGHVNQLSVAAWLPWLLTGLDRALGGSRRWAVAAAAVAGLMLLAGHPQQVYIGFALALVYAIVVAAARPRRRTRPEYLRAAAKGLVVWAAVAAVGALLAAAQLLPTLELSRESIRAGGLSLDEAASFSLPPREVLLGLLPTFTRLPSSTEFISYVGISGLLLAALGATFYGRRARVWLLLGVGIAAVVIALGLSTPLFAIAHRFIPGFDLFRVPARWTVLTVLSGALLAAFGTDALAKLARAGRHDLIMPVSRWLVSVAALAALGLLLAATQPPLPDGVVIPWLIAFAVAALVLAATLLRGWMWAVPLLVAIELGAASLPSDLRRPVPDEVYSPAGSVVPELVQARDGMRVLGLAEPSFEVDQSVRAELAARWRNALGEAAWREFLVARKQRDILGPNLPLAYGVSTPDGYDGGVLPLRTYVAYRDALFPGSGAKPDVLLQNQVADVPSGRVMDALGVAAVVQNRVMTLDFDGALLDLRFPRRVTDPLTISGLRLPDVTGLMLLANGGRAATGAPGGFIELATAAGATQRVPLSRPPDRPQRVRVGPGHLVSARPGLPEPAFLSTARFNLPGDVVRVTIDPGGALDVRALSLLQADGTARAIVLRPADPSIVEARGDVTVLRRQAPLGRVWFPANAHLVADAAAVDQGLRGAAFQPARDTWLQRRSPADSERDRNGFEAAGIVAAPEPVGLVGAADVAALRQAASDSAGSLHFDAEATARLLIDDPEHVVIEVTTDAPALMVLADANYPGWQAEVDGRPAPVWSANRLLRSVLVPGAGTHVVEFRYRSIPFETGRTISVVTAGVGLLGLTWAWLRRRRAA